jgi:hypothetical protein
MNTTCKEILNISGISFNCIDELENLEIDRDILLDINKYEIIKKKITELKKITSSNNLTCLHENASITQKWPLLNLVRQILKHYKYTMKPIRRCNGYTEDGIKRFKRSFLIEKIKYQNSLSSGNNNLSTVVLTQNI